VAGNGAARSDAAGVGAAQFAHPPSRYSTTKLVVAAAIGRQNIRPLAATKGVLEPRMAGKQQHNLKIGKNLRRNNTDQ
jgi:hypothetical protein